MVAEAAGSAALQDQGRRVGGTPAQGTIYDGALRKLRGAKPMLSKVDGHRMATDLAIKVLAQLLHRRGALDMIEFAEELEVRALLLGKTDDGSEVAPAATLAAEVLDELARDLREVASGFSTEEV